MDEPTMRQRRSSRWLAVIWVLGTIAAVTVSLAAVRLAGAQVTLRHSPPLSVDEVAKAVAEDRATGDDAADVAASVVTGDDLGSSSDDSVSGGSGSSRSSGSPGSGSGSSGGGGSDGSDDHGGSNTTVAPSDGGGPGGSGGGGSSSGPGPGPDGGGSDGGGSGHDGTTTTTTPPASVIFSKSTAGGAVTVLCTGDLVVLVSVTPSLGWPIDLRNSGPQEVEVRFGSQGDEVKVKARCSGSVVSWSS